MLQIAYIRFSIIRSISFLRVEFTKSASQSDKYFNELKTSWPLNFPLNARNDQLYIFNLPEGYLRSIIVELNLLKSTLQLGTIVPYIAHDFVFSVRTQPVVISLSYLTIAPIKN